MNQPHTPEDHREAMRSRLRGLVSPEFAQRRFLIVGIGAGSYGAEKLARLGPAALRLCDFDHVELSNLSRTAYTYADARASRSKAHALAQRLREVNPFVRVEPHEQNFLELPNGAQDALLDEVDVIIAGTDDFAAQARLNALAVRRGIPIVLAGIHARGEGGRVFWACPPETACYHCAAPERYAAAETAPEDLNLHGQPGLLFDAQFIDMIAYKVAAALAEREADSALGRFARAMHPRNDILIRCDPAYAWGQQMWDALLADLPTQPKPYARELQEAALFAMDSLWLHTPKNPACPTCGTPAA